jgi:hypothetical protein
MEWYAYSEPARRPRFDERPAAGLKAAHAVFEV